MQQRGKSASRAVLRLCPAPREPSLDSLSALCALPPSRGQFMLYGFDCRIVRRRDGILGCYIRVPYTHELYGRTDLNELSLALDCPDGITYSAGGAEGWFIGSATQLCWDDAWQLLDDLARQLADFVPSEVWSVPRVRRISGVQFKAAREDDATNVG